MKDSERFLIILVSLLSISLLLFLWDQNGRLQKTIQILHDDKKVPPSPPPPHNPLPLHEARQEATTARDAALEKLKATDARVATDMHAINTRHRLGRRQYRKSVVKRVMLVWAACSKPL
jgi:hypothetical protein